MADVPTPGTHTGGPREVRALVRNLTWEADGVVSVTVAAEDGTDLPPWQPGAHVDLVLPNGMRRQYSLCGDTEDRQTYQVSVDRAVDTRGGSEYVHLFLRPGQSVTVGTPRNHFALDVDETAWIFLAGGIGITPFLPLVRQAAEAQTPWHLHYAGRRRARMAYLRRLEQTAPVAWATSRTPALPRGGGVTAYETGAGARPDLDSLLGSLPAGAGVYACGPERLLDACEQAVVARPDLTLHSERFRPRVKTLPAPKAFDLVAQRSGLSAHVPPERSPLQVLESLGIRMDSGCRTGLCGACEVRVLAGEVEHRDDVLTERQRAAGNVMLPCVSRAVRSELMIDV